LILNNEFRVRFADNHLLPAIQSFLSVALTFWLEINSLRTLHASGIVLEKRAAVFLADSTAGKSTLAASLLQQGAALLSDDIVAVEATADSFLLRPAYASLRLSPAQVKHFMKKQSHLAVSIPKFSKCLVQLGPEGWAPFYDQVIPPTAFYVLDRTRPSEKKDLEIHELSHKDAVMVLLHSLFFPTSRNFIVDQAKRLDFLSRLAAQFPVKQLSYSSGYEHLPAVCEAIQSDLNSVRR
jgi:hypothetical protein